MKYLIVLSALFIVSCSTNEEKPEVKTYSDDTNQAFEMIERGGSYLKKAPVKSSPTPQIKAPTPKTSPAKKREEIIIKNTKTDERLIEINQNLAFYCMKHRKDKRFGDSEEKCMKFVNKVMNDCRNAHLIVNSKLLGCIKKKLKGIK